MPILHARPPRWTGQADHSTNPDAGLDSPPPWKMNETQLLTATAYDCRLNRTAKRESQLGTTVTDWTDARVWAMLQAMGQGYDRPLLWGSTGRARHFTGGVWVDLGVNITGGTSRYLQGANGMGITLVPFGESTALQKYNGSTISAVGGSAPVGFIGTYFHRLSARFLGWNGLNEVLFWSKTNDSTVWSATDGGQEPVGNDREPLIVIATGPGDLTSVLKRHRWFVIEKTDPRNWNIRVKTKDRGAAGMHAWCLGPDGTIFVAHDSGIWAMNGEGGILQKPLSLAFDRTWKALFKSFPGVVNSISLSYHPITETLYAIVPQDTIGPGRRIFRIYVPEGSWTVEDTITAGTRYFSIGATLKDLNSLEHVYYAEEDDTANTVKVFQLDALGARANATVEKLIGDPLTVKAFGEAPEIPGQGRKCVLFLKARGNYSVNATTKVWRADGTQQTSGPHAISLAGTAGQPLTVEVPVPEDVGQFLSVSLTNANADEPFDFEGLSCPYENIALGAQRQ